MSTWVNDLLSEWRKRFAAEPDSARPAEETGDPPTHALDLLRVHVKRSGVQLRLTEVPTTPTRANRAALQPASGGATSDGSDDGGLVRDHARFGKRRPFLRATDLPKRLLRLPREAMRAPGAGADGAADGQPGAGPAPTKQWKEAPAPADVRLAADAFRAAAYGEVEALRADVARLKETLADVLVENHQLKRLLQVQWQGAAERGA